MLTRAPRGGRTGDTNRAGAPAIQGPRVHVRPNRRGPTTMAIFRTLHSALGRFSDRTRDHDIERAQATHHMRLGADQTAMLKARQNQGPIGFVR